MDEEEGTRSMRRYNEEEDAGGGGGGGVFVCAWEVREITQRGCRSPKKRTGRGVFVCGAYRVGGGHHQPHTLVGRGCGPPLLAHLILPR